jgi:hypothetical protein
MPQMAEFVAPARHVSGGACAPVSNSGLPVRRRKTRPVRKSRYPNFGAFRRKSGGQGFAPKVFHKQIQWIGRLFEGCYPTLHARAHTAAMAQLFADRFDWELAIDRNRMDLPRVVAALFASVGLAETVRGSVPKTVTLPRRPCRRLIALRRALDDLPGQTKRMALAGEDPAALARAEAMLAGQARLSARPAQATHPRCRRGPRRMPHAGDVDRAEPGEATIIPGPDPGPRMMKIQRCAPVSGARNQRGMPHALSSHSCSRALWNFHMRFGPAMTFR